VRYLPWTKRACHLPNCVRTPLLLSSCIDWLLFPNLHLIKCTLARF
jgi:hypothetical protein